MTRGLVADVVQDALLLGQGYVLMVVTADVQARTLGTQRLRVDPLCFGVVDALPVLQHQPGCACTRWLS